MSDLVQMILYCPSIKFFIGPIFDYFGEFQSRHAAKYLKKPSDLSDKFKIWLLRWITLDSLERNRFSKIQSFFIKYS